MEVFSEDVIHGTEWYERAGHTMIWVKAEHSRQREQGLQRLQEQTVFGLFDKTQKAEYLVIRE